MCEAAIVPSGRVQRTQSLVSEIDNEATVDAVQNELALWSEKLLVGVLRADLGIGASGDVGRKMRTAFSDDSNVRVFVEQTPFDKASSSTINSAALGRISWGFSLLHGSARVETKASSISPTSSWSASETTCGCQIYGIVVLRGGCLLQFRDGVEPDSLEVCSSADALFREPLQAALAEVLLPASGGALSVFVDPARPSATNVDFESATTPGIDDGTETCVEFPFEVELFDPNDRDPVSEALRLEEMFGGAKRLLPSLAEGLEVPVGRLSLRIQLFCHSE